MDSNNTIVLLIILTIILFTKSTIHILFDNDILNIDKSNYNQFDEIVSYVLSLIAAMRFFIITLILMTRSVKKDFLTYILYYLLVTAILRIWYEYLAIFNKQSALYKLFDKYQDIDSILIFLSTGYIIKYIFF
jgi:hypothetical protein